VLTQIFIPFKKGVQGLFGSNKQHLTSPFLVVPVIIGGMLASGAMSMPA